MTTLFFDPNALYRISSANRSGTLKGEAASLNSSNPASTLTHNPSNNTANLANINMANPTNDSTQLWMFRWTTGQPFNLSIHNPQTGLNNCVERNADGTLKIAKRDSNKDSTQAWWISIAPTGNGKWHIMGQNQNGNLEIKKNTPNVAWMADQGDGERTLWHIQHVGVANIGTGGTVALLQ